MAACHGIQSSWRMCVQGQLCVLAEDCDQPDYKKLVEALCSEHNVNLLSVPEAKQLGQWAGVSATPPSLTSLASLSTDPFSLLPAVRLRWCLLLRKRPLIHQQGSSLHCLLFAKCQAFTLSTTHLRHLRAQRVAALKLQSAVQLCKIDAEGEARKVVGCSSVVVTNWGEETPGRAVLQEYLKNVSIRTLHVCSCRTIMAV